MDDDERRSQTPFEALHCEISKRLQRRQKSHDVLRSIFRRTTECVVCAAVKSCQFNKEARNSKHTKVFWLNEQRRREDEWILESDFNLLSFFFAAAPFQTMLNDFTAWNTRNSLVSLCSKLPALESI